MAAERKFDHEIGFDFTKLPPSQWGHHFLSVTITDSDFDVLERRIEELKPQVRDMLMLSPKDDQFMKRKILLIHLLVSLGLSYLFEIEIEEIVKHGFEKIQDLIANEDDLYTISTMFRVFRTYGHNMSSDAFKRFKGDDGKFKECLIDDVKGVLSLYEAVHFRTRTDYILDEASSFTLNHLKPLAQGHIASPPHMLRLIQSALHIPQHRNIQALVAREYISFYEQEEDHYKELLNLAKLNFKLLQLHYFQELKTITKWWKELEHTSNLRVKFKERTVETWFAALMIYLEPQFSLGRIMSAKLYLVITFLDDACDIHGSIPEVVGLVDCLERWDPDCMEELDGHMKTAFKFVMYCFRDFDEVMKFQGRSFAFEEMKEEFMILVRANLELIKWARAGQVPNFDEYIEAGGVEIGSYATMACSIMGLGEIGKKEDFEWLRSRPKLVRSLAAKTRLLDDIADFEEDMSKGYTANAVNYYMKEQGLTKEATIKEFEKMIGDINKIVNEECLETTTTARRVLMLIVNYGRLLDVLYTGDDVYNHREGKLKEYMSRLLVDPILL